MIQSCYRDEADSRKVHYSVHATKQAPVVPGVSALMDRYSRTSAKFKKAWADLIASISCFHQKSKVGYSGMDGGPAYITYHLYNLPSIICISTTNNHSQAVVLP